MKFRVLFPLFATIALAAGCFDDTTTSAGSSAFSITGTISGADSVAVTLSGDGSETQVVYTGGTYGFGAGKGKTYTVTPSKAGYVFSPPSQTFTNVSADRAQDFTASTGYKISGTITGATGVTVTLSGASSGAQTVTSDGTYSFTVAAGGTYTVTVFKSGYAFSPQTETIRNVSANNLKSFSVALSGLTGTLVFDRESNGEYTSICTLNPDGSTPAPLTSFASSSSPSWSPDGTKIAFCRNNTIYVMSADGSNARQLTASSYYNPSPAWSPDGTKIAFSRSQGIYVISSSGIDTTTTRLTFSCDYYPSWSPDGTKIAFCRSLGADNTVGIHVISSSGTDTTTTRLTSSYDYYSSWSPDGTKIAFCRQSNGIYVMSADGSNVEQLTPSGLSPAWSPDGTKIAFFRGSNIYVMKADGTSEAQISTEEVYSHISWKR